jgi:hypothetical protein
MLRLSVVVVGVAVNLFACTAEQPAVGYPAGLGTPESPLPHPEPYIVRSRVTVPLGIADVTAAVAQLQAFSQHGGTALLAQNQDLPAVQALNALPSTLRTKLDGWIDVELDKQKLGATLTARAAVGQIAMIADTVTNNFVVESMLTLSPNGAVHQLSDLNFEPLGMDVVVPIGGLIADVLNQKPSATVAEAGALTLGDQKFGLAFGSHAWQAIELASGQTLGGGIEIMEKLDCNAIAQSVAARCVSSTCVGHASDLLAVCQQGLTSLVEQLRGSLTPVVLDSLRFKSGTARLVDDNQDGYADRILDGTWNTETDDGMGVRTSQVTFTAQE